MLDPRGIDSFHVSATTCAVTRTAGVTVAVLLLLGGMSPRASWAQSRDAVPRASSAQPARLTLDDALELATETSEQIQIARAGVDRATGSELRAQSALFPQLDASFAYTRLIRSEFDGIFDQVAPPCDPLAVDPAASLAGRVGEVERALLECPPSPNIFGDEEIPFGQENIWSLNLAFSQALYTGGRVSAQTASAGASQRAAALGVETTRAQVELDVATAYFDAALSDRLITIAEAALEQAEATLNDVELEWKVGSQSEFEVLRARVARDSQQPIVIRARSQREIAHLRLRQLLDLPIDQPLELDVDLDAVTGPPAERFASALAEREAQVAEVERTAVQQVAAQVAASDASVRAARAERMPHLALTSAYNPVAYRSTPQDFRTNWNVGVAVSIPVLTGGRLRAGETTARADLAENEARLQQAREIATLDTRTAYEDYRAARATWEASAGTAEQAVRAHEIAELRFREGLSTQLELSDARLQLEQARANRAQAARDLQVSRTRLALLPHLPLPEIAAGATAAARERQPSPAAEPSGAATPAPGGLTTGGTIR